MSPPSTFGNKHGATDFESAHPATLDPVINTTDMNGKSKNARTMQFTLDAFNPPRTTYKNEKLPPVDPKHKPLHAILFLGGLVFFPLWFYGAFKKADDNFAEMHRWRCQALAMITSIIIAAMLIMQLGFRTL